MELTISASSLSAALSKLSNVVEKRTTLPILSHVMIQAEDENITITGSDLEKECAVTTQATVKAGGSICLEWKKLADIASNAIFKGKDITIKLGAGKAAVSAGKSKFTVNTLPSEDFPSLEHIEKPGIELTLSSLTLRSLLETVSHAMAVQDVRYYLNGALLELSQGKITAVATDGHREAVAETAAATELDGTRELIMPRTAVTALLALLKEDQELKLTAVEHQRFEIRLNGLVFRSKVIDGKFPDWRRAVPQNDHAAIVDRNLLLQHIAAAQIVATPGKDGGASIYVTFDPADGGQVRVMSRSGGEETDLEPIPAEYTGPLAEFGFGSRYLAEALQEVTSDRVQIELQQSGSSILLRAPETDAPLFVVSPRRV